jgi:cyanate permease
MIATLVDTSALAKVVVASLVATIGLTAAFAAAILGATRFAEMRRDERPLEAGLFAGIAFVGLGICVAGVVVGIVVMTSK